MKIKIKDLHPNPYRDLENYPINREKVEALKASIKQTGFWDNILARETDKQIQIAYGHHRLIALQESLKEDDIVDIPVKELPDSVMIQVMANENMDEWKVSPSVIDETVRVAKEFLEQHPEELKKYQKYKSIPGTTGISNFLGWRNEDRVSDSLSRINLIKAGTLDKEVIKEMPTERHAREFATAIKRDPIPKVKQRQFAKEIQKSFDPDSKKDQIPSREIHTMILEDKWKPEKKDSKEEREEKELKKRLITMETLLRSVLFTSREMIDELKDLVKITDEFGDSLIIENKTLRIQVTENFKTVYELLSNILNKENHE